MNDLTGANQKLTALIDLLHRSAGLNLTAHISQNVSLNVSQTGSDEPLQTPELVVELTGPDTPLLTDRNGELLHAIEHIAAKILALHPEEHHRISFDADHFKANRDRQLRQLADAAIVKVRTTCAAYVFPPMMSRERRLLHLALASSGLKSASTGERFHRSVVLYPEGVHPPTT